MSNILEQEDIVKGLPDAALDSEMQQPSGQLPQFLILSEIHRRTEMRNNFAANEDDFSTPVVDQMLAASSASRQGLGTPMDPASAMGQPELSAMDQASPVPSMPSPSSAIPVGGVPQGLGGMGVQLASGGGVVGMAEAGQVPTSLKALRNGEAVVLARGENPDDFSVADLEYIGRTSPNQLGFMSNFMGKNHPALGFGRYQSPVAELDASPLDTPPLDYNEVLSGQSLSPEIAYEQRSGRDIDAPSVWEDAASGMAEDLTEENYPFTFMSEEDRARMPFGDKVVGDVREGGERAFEYVKNYVPAAGRRLINMATVGVSGDPRSPELVREEAGQDIGSAYDRFVTEPAAEIGDALKQGYGETVEDVQRLSQPIQDWAQDFDMVESGADAYNAAKNYLGDDLGLREWAQNFDMAEAATDLYDSTAGFREGVGDWWNEDNFKKTVRRDGVGGIVRDWWNEDNWIASGLEGFASLTTGIPDMDDHREAVSETNAVVTDLGRSTANGDTDILDTTYRSEISDAQSSQDRMRQDAAFLSGNQRDPQFRYGMLDEDDASFGILGDLGDEVDLLRSGQASELENLESLIESTRANAKKQAFYLGMMALGAGISKGEMGEGMEQATEVAGETLARGEGRAVPLEAAMIAAPRQGARDRIDALAAMASADAEYRRVSASIYQQGQTTERSRHQLYRAVLPLAQEILMEEGILPGDPTFQAALKNLVGEYMSYDVGGTNNQNMSDGQGSNLIPNSNGGYTYVQ